jgi:hypothetical protein
MAMADAGLFLGFGSPYPGRERQALKVFAELLEYLGGLQGRGALESVEPVLLQAHGGDLGGFVLVRGSVEQMGQIQASQEFQTRINRGLLVVSALGVVPAFIGEGMQRAFADYSSHLDELT